VGRVLYGKTAAEDPTQFYTTAGTITSLEQYGYDLGIVPDVDTLVAGVEYLKTNKTYDEEKSTKYVVIQDEDGTCCQRISYERDIHAEF
jgi:siroheme synthase